MEMSDGNDVNTNTSTDDKYSTLGATNNSETETRVSLCENSQDFGSHNNSIRTASEANIETLKVAHTVLFQKSEEILSALGDITNAGVDRDILESAVKETTIGGVKEDKLAGFEESIKEIKTSEHGGGDASVNCLGCTEPKDPAVCTTEVTDSRKNISEKTYYSLAEVNTDGKEDNAKLVQTDDHRGKSSKESGICMQTVEDIVIDPPANTEQVNTAINSTHDSALHYIETDKEENIEVDLSENTEHQVNTAIDSVCNSSLQDTETDKEENIEVDLSENTEHQVNTAIDSACDSSLQDTKTDEEENIEVDLSENTEHQVNTAIDSACDSSLQDTETDKEENIEVDRSENTKQLVSTAIDSAFRILKCTKAGASIGNTYKGVGIERGEESTPREQTVQNVNIDERGTDKPKESINKDTTEVIKFLNEGNNLETTLTNSAEAIKLHSVTENEGTVTKRPETYVTETQTDCPQTDKTELEVEIISSNTNNSDIKISGAGEGEIIKCLYKDNTNFICSPDHIPEIFITSAKSILADLPSTLETQKTKVETDIQEDDPMDVDLTQNETTLTEDVEKPLETTKHIGFPDIGYNNNFNQSNLDNLSNYNDAQEPMEITEHSILNYDDKDFDTDNDFEAEAHVSGGESKKPEAAEKEPEPEAAEKEPELEVKETQEKKMGCIKSKAKRNQNTGNQHGWSSGEENEENGWQTQQSKKSKPSTFRNDSWSTRDTNTYRERYPGKKDNPDLNANLKFYKGRITSCPKGDYIDEIHRKWWGNYDKLEQHHGYIQWLFPIREQGMNWHAQELQPHEAKAIMADSEAMERFLNSYKMMLNFYGMELVSEKTGEVKRSKNCQERFRHLNHSMHNYLRITRILKCLGEFGLEHYKAPFICFMLKEAIVDKTLDRTLDSCFKYWIGTLRNDEEREDINKYIDELYNDLFQEEENRKRKSGGENFKMVEIKKWVGEEESKGKNKQEENRKRQKENSRKKEEEEGKKSQEEENRREDEETRKRQEEENWNKEKENERVDDETGKRKEEENRKREEENERVNNETKMRQEEENTKREEKNESVLDDTRKEEENKKREEENERGNNETRMRQEEENTKREEKNESVLDDTRKEEENRKREEENESVNNETRMRREEENRKREEENDETRMSQDEENTKSEEENESVLDGTRKKEEENGKREEENDETRMRQDEENTKSEEENESVLDDTRKKEEENRKREEENDETRMRQDEENRKREEENASVNDDTRKRKEKDRNGIKEEECRNMTEEYERELEKDKEKYEAVD